MTAFPSGVTNNVNTSNLDSATDQPKNARADLLTLTQRVNQMINSFNANSGICGLDSQGKVDSAKLIGQIDTAQLAGDAVNSDKIDDDAVDSEHIVTGAVDYDHISFGSTATDLGGDTPANNAVPTQAAVKTYVDAEIAAADTSVAMSGISTLFNGSTNSSTTTHSGTASSDLLIIATAQYRISTGRGIPQRAPKVSFTIAGKTFSQVHSNQEPISFSAWVKKGESYSVTVVNGTQTAGKAYYRSFGFTA